MSLLRDSCHMTALKKEDLGNLYKTCVHTGRSFSVLYIYTDLDQYVCACDVDFLFMTVERTYKYAGKIKHNIIALFY
jgi:hypothetical protein